MPRQVILHSTTQLCNSTSLSPHRLRLSPSPPPARVISVTRTSGSGTHTQTRTAQSSSSRNSSGSAKKRRLNDTDSEASSVAGGMVTRTRITQQASASGRVTVDEVDLEGKFVRLSNKADQVRRPELSFQPSTVIQYDKLKTGPLFTGTNDQFIDFIKWR